jgi:hypothetical protein
MFSCELGPSYLKLRLVELEHQAGPAGGREVLGAVGDHGRATLRLPLLDVESAPGRGTYAGPLAAMINSRGRNIGVGLGRASSAPSLTSRAEKPTRE